MGEDGLREVLDLVQGLHTDSFTQFCPIGGQDCALTERVGDGGREAEVQELQV